MRVLFILFVFGGMAYGQCAGGKCAPPPATVLQAPPPMVFQAPRQTIQVRVPAPQIQIIQDQPTLQFVAPQPRTVWVPAPAASFSAPLWVGAPSVFVAPAPRVIERRYGPFGRLRNERISN